MTDKEIIDDGVDVSGCNCFIEKMNFPNNLEGGYYNQNNLCECGVQGVESYPFFCRDNPNCHYKQLKRKEQECELLKEDEKYLLNVIDHLQKQKNEWEEKYNDLGQDFDQLKAENEDLRRSITKIFACLIKANRGGKIIDTLWVDNIITLWDYIALTLGIEGDQTQVEEQILRKIS